MGYRTYLTINDIDKNEEIFEANNSIPFFWLTLIDNEIIKDFQVNLNDKGSYPNEEALNPVLRISKKSFLANAETGRYFILNNYQEYVQLYNDFIYYLNAKISADGFVELDILDISNFSSENILLEDLKNEIAAIKNNKPANITFLKGRIDILSMLTGFDGFLCNQFRGISEQYNKALEDNKKEKELFFEKRSVTEKKAHRKEKRVGLFMCLWGILLIIICIAGWIKNSFSILQLTGIGLFGILSLVFGAFKIK